MENYVIFFLSAAVIILSCLSYILYRQKERLAKISFVNENVEGSNVALPMVLPLNPVEKAVANSNIKAFRKENASNILDLSKVKLVYHTWATFKRYVLEDFPNFVKNHPLPDSYEWGIGFYPAINLDNLNKLEIYVIPTIANKKTQTIIDYYGIQFENVQEEYINYYNTKKPTIGSGVATITDDNFIQDIGQDYP